MDKMKTFSPKITDSVKAQPSTPSMSARAGANNIRATFESILSNLSAAKYAQLAPDQTTAAAHVTFPSGGLSDLFSGQAKPRFHERVLGLPAYRQELLASNIANVDTPGYKAIDIDIYSAIKRESTAESGIELRYEQQNQGRIDGNTVDMDIARQKFSENALMYEFELDRVKGFYKSMHDLLKNTP